MTSAVKPIEWLQSLGNFLNDFFEAQCRVEVERRKGSGFKVENKLQASVRKVTTSTHKSSQLEKRRSSLTLSTPLKDKDKSPNINSTTLLSSTDFTPKPSQLSSSSATPFTEGRTRRTAATKADKYIDIVSRRLAEVPANGSTPKSMKIASKLISEATPNSRRNILLSSTLNSGTSRSATAETISQPVATPVSVRKRNRAAKIREMFQTPLMSLASAAASNRNESGSLSPTAIDLAPSTISKSSKLNQVHLNDVKRSSRKDSPEKKSSPRRKISPIKTSLESPLRRSQRVSPARVYESSKVQQKPSPLKDQITVKVPQIEVSVGPAVSATPKTAKTHLVEFVAPQSVLRSSKRPRKQIDTSIYNEDSSSAVSPIVKKQAKFADPSIFPTVTVNSRSHIKIAPPQTPQGNTITQTSATPSISVVIGSNSARFSTVTANVPAIIIPFSAARSEEETSSSEDLTALAVTSSKRTPLRVQPMRTPTRAKAVIPSLSDYSAATKIAVIEVAKNNSNVNNNSNPSSTTASTNNATPKVEPWTARFMQKDSTTTAPTILKSSLNINIKPVDTSKISGFSNTNGPAAVPIVPKFPLNLANISNITKSSSSTLVSETIASTTAKGIVPVLTVVPVVPIAQVSEAIQVIPPESPLTRAKRIDSENSSRDGKMKTLAAESESKSDKFKRVIGELSNESSSSGIVKISSTVPVTSKLPVKPKSSSTVLPSPKIPSRLAEAFSGIDSELPPIDMAGLTDDETILKNVLAGRTATSSNSSGSSGLANPKMKKQPAVNNSNVPVTVIPATPTTAATQLHRTAVLNSAARKINPATTAPSTTGPSIKQNLPTTPKPQPIIAVPSKAPVNLDTSSPNLPEIHSDDELDKREKMQGKENRPTWAMTPNLTVALNAQKSQRAEDVFGKVQPIKLEDFFKGSGKKFPNRSSTSNWNNNI